MSLLSRIGDSFKVDIFHKLGLEGSSKDWEVLTRGIIKEWEENNSGTDMFHVKHFILNYKEIRGTQK